MNKLIVFVLTVIVTIVSGKTIKQTNIDTAKDELEKYIEAKKSEINQRYRLHYHVSGPVGWINDPNGFSYYKGEYHLFYQFYPYDSIWGPMHWGHVKSLDLVNWEQLPTALLPEKEQCFSGSAVVDGDEMILMYTGHEITDVDPFFNQSQYLAYSTDGVNFDKFEGNPVIPAAPNGSPDFRDPKVWKHEEHWYVVLGSKTEDNRGRVLLYRSPDMINWEYLTVLAESDGSLGYMWECPDFFELDGKHILLMSPQGIQPDGDRFNNVHQTGYMIGNFNYDTFQFSIEVEAFQEIDFGHDFYAAQTTEANGKRYLVGWFNMWETPHLEDADGWAGTMTIVRELKLSRNKIIMKPVESMTSLREENYIAGVWEINQDLSFNKTAEIIIEVDLLKQVELELTGSEGGQKVWIRWNPGTQKVAVDRGNGDIRQMNWYPVESKQWRIFLDASSLELFCGEGEVVFSSRVYPDGGWKITNLSDQSFYVEAFRLKRSVPV